MLEESVTYSPGGGYPLYLTAKRYWLPDFEANSKDPDALTLLFLHATSFHKETWMPTLEALFTMASSAGSPVKIREAWCLDCPNHGESAQLNADALLRPEFYLSFSCERYAQAAHRFLSVGPDQGGRVDFRTRNLVGVGHSLGGCSITILQAIKPAFPFSSLVLIEPLISPAGPHHLRRLREDLVKGAYERRDVWPDRAQAWAALNGREARKRWDPRILKLYVEYGIVEHPGARFPEGAYHGVTLACTRDQEATMYRDPEGGTKPLENLASVARACPVHLILGEIPDCLSKDVHAAIMEAAPYASRTVIKGAGHQTVQEVPDRVARAVYDALVMNARDNHTRSRL